MRKRGDPGGKKRNGEILKPGALRVLNTAARYKTRARAREIKIFIAPSVSLHGRRTSKKKGNKPVISAKIALTHAPAMHGPVRAYALY